MGIAFLRYFSLFFFTLFCFFSTQAQEADPSEGLRLYQSAKAMFDSAKYELAGKFFKQSQDEFLDKKLWDHYANATEAYAGSFHAIGKSEKASSVLMAGIDSVEKYLGRESFFMGTLYNSLGAVYYYKGECQKAFPNIKKGIEIMEKIQPDHPSLAMAYSNLGMCADIIENLDNALAYFDKSLGLFLDKYGEEHERVAMVCTNIGWTYSALGDYDKQGEYYQRSLNIRRKIYGGKHVKLVPNYINMGAYHYRRGNYAKMFEYAKKSLRNIKENDFETHPYLSTIYLNHANYYDAINDYQGATPFYLKSIEEDQKVRGPYHPNLAVSHFDLADNYNYLHDYEKALAAYQKGREICEKNGEVNILDQANGYRAGGRIWVNLGEYQKANALFFKALEIYRREVDEYHPRIRGILLEIASVYAKMGNRSRQLEMYYQAIGQYFFSKNTDAIGLGKVYLKLAQYYSETDLNDSTSFYVQKCMKLFCHDLIDSDFKQLPSWNEMAFPEEMIKVLKLHANLQLVEGKPDETKLLKGLKSYLLATQIIDSIRFNQVSFSGKRDLGATANSVYEGGIKISRALEQVTGNQTYFDQAFIFAERGKSTLLYQAIQEAEARISAGIPDSIYALEADLKLSLMFYRNKINEEITKPGGEADQAKITLWRGKVFRLNQTKDSLISRLEKDYSRYFQLKYAVKIPSIEEIQDLLSENEEDLLAYFEGEEELFAFWISGDEKALYTIKKDFPLEDWIESLRNSIYGPFTEANMNDSMTNVMRTAYADYGYRLFSRLIPSDLRIGREKNRKLVIIPDGSLGYLPFDGLLTEPPARLGRYRSYSYLLKSTSLSYAYSATLFLHDYSDRQFSLPKKRLIAFSPGFKQSDELFASSRSDLGELAFSKDEVNAVKNSLGGDVFLDEEATEDRFKELAGGYQMIHISSHAMVNDEKPLRSQIAFSSSQDTLEDNFLSLEELFHLKLPAEMVVLSACETGIGKLFRGEGISSLARGFSYAGARSIITTLWKVNDESTASIISDFYQNLDQGMNKNDALRQAKLSYLETADHLTAHPFYWSGYIPIGNMEPVDDHGFQWWWLFVILAVGLGLSKVIRIRRQR